MAQIPVSEQLKKKYHKTDEVDNFKQLLERSATIYKTRIAFKLKNEKNEIYSVTYEQLKNDVQSLGTYLISQGLLNKRICVIGKNSYKWAISYLAASIVGVVVPIDKELHSRDVINFINVSESLAVLGDDKILSVISADKSILKNQNLLFCM